MTLTDHAIARWKERCGSLDPSEEWRKSKPCNRKTKARIRRSCPAHESLAWFSYRGVYYRISRMSRVIFVVTPPETIVTVFVLTKNGR